MKNFEIFGTYRGAFHTYTNLHTFNRTSSIAFNHPPSNDIRVRFGTPFHNSGLPGRPALGRKTATEKYFRRHLSNFGYREGEHYYIDGNTHTCKLFYLYSAHFEDHRLFYSQIV